MPNMLTTVERVNDWFNQSGQSNPLENKKLISQLIARVSDVVLNQFLNRPSITYHSVNEVIRGNGGNATFLRQFPVLSVSSLTLPGNIVVPAVPSGQMSRGFILSPWDGLPPGDPQMLSLLGYCFPTGILTGLVSYKAGYAVLNEVQTIPTPSGSVTPNQGPGLWAGDVSVAYASGTLLTPVSANPGAGQYVPPDPFSLSDPHFHYLFSEADFGAAILINYSYIPWAIEGAVCDTVGERLSYRGRIGVSSKSLASQETISFSQKDLPDYTAAGLYPYKNINSVF